MLVQGAVGRQTQAFDVMTSLNQHAVYLFILIISDSQSDDILHVLYKAPLLWKCSPVSNYNAVDAIFRVSAAQPCRN